MYGRGDLKIESEDIEELDSNQILVNMKRGGICGSDLHYFHDGGIGSIQIQEPIILGHELSGMVQEVGSAVNSLKAGDKVAINPSHPCMDCSYCHAQVYQHCKFMRFLGSAKTMPHVQGGFRDFLIVEASQCFRLNDNVGLGEAACAEPLSVCIHAAKQAGDINSKRILVTGAGPIGSLCVAVASRHSALEIVVTDLSEFTLNIASEMGADRCINIEENPDALSKEVLKNGLFDIVFECSGDVNAIKSAIESVKPQGTIVQVGLAGDETIPLNLIVGKEISLKGSHRFHVEFSEAVELINNFNINLTPLITQTVPLEDAVQGLILASDRSISMKVQLVLGQSS